ncbi:MAG: DUF4124 domain-containing protein [Burkholderiaceae bacterium]|jgi:hypothetical protein|nr:DUF4124 domain-containing protein [Burkholderiaceae bacterium]
MRPTLVAALIGLAVVAPLAQAQLYVCTDARGRTITGDRPPAECADRAVRELRSDGSVRRVIEPPLTPEQKAARDAEAKRQRDEAEKQRSQMRRDLALLETYASEAEIEETRNRALGSRQQLIDRAQQRLLDHQKERKKLDSEAEFYAKREMPDKLKRSFDSNAALMRSEQRIIDDVKADMERVNGRFDAELKRWRDLVTSGAQPVQRASGQPQ